MRKLILALGLLFFVVGGLFAWRASRPTLTPEDQVLAQLQGVAGAASSRQVRGVLSYLTSDFTFGNTTKKEFAKSLQAAFFQSRSGLKVDVSGVTVTVEGENATTTGHYTVLTQGDGALVNQTFTGDFTLKWRLENGQWKVYSAEGQQPVGL